MSKRKHTKALPRNSPKVPLEASVPSALGFGVWAGVALIVVVTVIAYLPSLKGGFIWDDNDIYITKNQIVKAADGLYRFWFTTEPDEYYPVSNTTFWIEWRLWGISPSGYHATNLLLHIAAALLIWVILRELSIPGSFLAALIFALHPVNVESVAWIAQRKDVLAILFFLLSILCYLKFIPLAHLRFAAKQIPDPHFLIPIPWYWLSLGSFILAMLSKGSVAVLPVLLLGIARWFHPLTRRDLVRTAPFFVISLVLTCVNIWFQTHGCGEVIRIAGFAERLLGAGGVVWFYLYKTLVPMNLIFFYPQWHIQVGNLLWWLPLGAAIIVTLVLWRYRESWSRPLLFAWGFFCVALAPVMGFTDVYFMKYSLVADHYQHLAIIGVIALVSAYWSIWHQRFRGAAYSIGSFIAITAVSALAFLTWQQNGIYHDEFTMYQDTLKNNPDCWLAHYNLGTLFAEKELSDEAIKHYKKALEIKPDYPEAQNNLGAVYKKLGDYQQALEHYNEALRLKPDYCEAYSNIGVVLYEAGRFQDSMKYCERALEVNPNYAEAHNNLGNVLMETKQYQEAINHFKKALEIKPDYAEALYNLGNVLLRTNRYQEATQQYKKALEIKPDYVEARNNLGSALDKIGEVQESIEQYRLVLRFNPNIAQIYYNLALAYAKTNQPSQAVAIARKGAEVARSQGQTALAELIENWLSTYNSGR